MVLPDLDTSLVQPPPGVDRGTFVMRSAIIGAAAAITGCSVPDKKEQPAAPAPAAPPQPASAVSEDLDVVKKAKDPVMTTIDEFYKVGPGPSLPRRSKGRVLCFGSLD